MSVENTITTEIRERREEEDLRDLASFGYAEDVTPVTPVGDEMIMDGSELGRI